MPRARPAARDDSPGLGCSRGGRKWGMDVTPDVTPGSRSRPAPGGTLCHREPPHPVRPGDPVGCGIKPPPGVTGQTGSAAPSPLSCKDKAARRGHSGAAGMGMGTGTAGVQLGVCVFGGGETCLTPKHGPEGERGRRAGTYRKGGSGTEADLLHGAEQQAAGGHAALAPRLGDGFTGGFGMGPPEPSSVPHRRPGGGQVLPQWEPGNASPPSLRPSVPPSFPPSLPPQRSQHPRIPASELVPRSHTLTGPS